ncbi:hypothetical protein B0H17DRAFT_1027241 [Mycena rosella]|uniref:Uncharacterized protein n=1 Tax=Mycena rosella TaxID=1033263 RepID=A0AAD7H240_MYCRO|nr:hypothetical protein B0H17DRAFT_1027241 [Mycena rosella]
MASSFFIDGAENFLDIKASEHPVGKSRLARPPLHPNALHILPAHVHDYFLGGVLGHGEDFILNKDYMGGNILLQMQATLADESLSGNFNLGGGYLGYDSPNMFSNGDVAHLAPDFADVTTDEEMEVVNDDLLNLVWLLQATFGGELTATLLPEDDAEGEMCLKLLELDVAAMAVEASTWIEKNGDILKPLMSTSWLNAVICDGFEGFTRATHELPSDDSPGRVIDAEWLEQDADSWGKAVMEVDASTWVEKNGDILRFKASHHISTTRANEPSSFDSPCMDFADFTPSPFFDSRLFEDPPTDAVSVCKPCPALFLPPLAESSCLPLTDAQGFNDWDSQFAMLSDHQLPDVTNSRGDSVFSYDQTQLSIHSPAAVAFPTSLVYLSSTTSAPFSPWPLEAIHGFAADRPLSRQGRQHTKVNIRGCNPSPDLDVHTRVARVPPAHQRGAFMWDGCDTEISLEPAEVSEHMVAVHDIQYHDAERVPVSCRHRNCGDSARRFGRRGPEYGTLSKLIGHIRSVHVGAYAVACPYCSGMQKSFVSRSNLKLHLHRRVLASQSG